MEEKKSFVELKINLKVKI